MRQAARNCFSLSVHATRMRMNESISSKNPLRFKIISIGFSFALDMVLRTKHQPFVNHTKPKARMLYQKRITDHLFLESYPRYIHTFYFYNDYGTLDNTMHLAVSRETRNFITTYQY